MKPDKFVLYADDDVDDKEWVTDACKAVDQNLQMIFVDNGRQVLEYLSQEPAHLPSLIVLDLNMPEMDGRQTLQQLKAQAQFQAIPVAIVTTSTNNIDREVCQRLGASIYLSKPDSHQAWQHIVRQLLPFVANES